MRMLQIEPRITRVVVVAALLFAVLGGCSEESAPEVPVDADGVADPVLEQGRDVWRANCSRCHGGAGGGGAGPALEGPWPADREPNADTMFATVTEGRGAMPRFGGALDDDEIEAVIRYIRTVL